MSDDWTDVVKQAMLTRRVTLDDYFADIMGLVRKGLVAQAAIDRAKAELSARANPGDEWWEWVLGSDPLMQMGGLALLREGRVVWAQNDWIS